VTTDNHFTAAIARIIKHSRWTLSAGLSHSSNKLLSDCKVLTVTQHLHNCKRLTE